MMRTPGEAVNDFVVKYEGLFQNDPEDDANYVTLSDGSQRLIGTMRGVSAPAYLARTGISADLLTPEMLRQGATLDMAVLIGVEAFYVGMRINRLIWCAATEALLDYAWGSGYAGLMRVQEHLLKFQGAAIDGVIGPNTINRWRLFVGAGDVASLDLLCTCRLDHYRDIVRKWPDKAQYLYGWKRRAASFTVTTKWYSDNWLRKNSQ